MMIFGNSGHMSMMTTIKSGQGVIGWKLLLLLFLIILCFFIWQFKERKEREAQLSVFQSGKGWGYRIIRGRKILIYQSTIPAIDTVMAFPDKVSARRVGMLVLRKFNEGRNFSVSRKEVIQSISCAAKVVNQVNQPDKNGNGK